MIQEMATRAYLGGSAGGWVAAECAGGTPTYSGDAFACGLASSQDCVFCPATGTISAGDSVHFSESVDEDSGDPNDSAIGGQMSDTTAGAGANCQNAGAFTTSDAVYTGICGEDIDQNGPQSGCSQVAPPNVGCQLGNRPKMSPVDFTNITADEQSFGSWNPKRYDMVAGTTLQLSTGNLHDGGESFRDLFVHH